MIVTLQTLVPLVFVVVVCCCCYFGVILTPVVADVFFFDGVVSLLTRNVVTLVPVVGGVVVSFVDVVVLINIQRTIFVYSFLNPPKLLTSYIQEEVGYSIWI